MSRRKRRTNKPEDSIESTDTMPTSNNPLQEAYMQLAVEPIGGYFPRSLFVPDELDESLKVVFLRTIPFATFRNGLRYEGHTSADDYTHPTLLRGAPVADDLDYAHRSYSKTNLEGYSWSAVTPVGSDFLIRHWPVYQAHFAKGLKSDGIEVSQVMFFAVIANGMRMLGGIRDLQKVLSLGELSRDVPELASITTHYTTTLKGFKTEWKHRLESIIQFVENLPMLPGMVVEHTRMSLPFLNSLNNETLMIPLENMFGDNSVTDANYISTVLTELEAYRSWMMTEAAEDVHAVRKILPMVGRINDLIIAPADPYRTEAALNSHTHDMSIAGNTGDWAKFTMLLNEDANETMGFIANPDNVFNQETSSLSESDSEALLASAAYRAIHHNVMGEPYALSIMSSSVMVTDNDTTDAEYVNAGLHHYGKRCYFGHTSYSDSTVIRVDVDDFHMPEGHKQHSRAVLNGIIQEDTDEFFLPEGKKVKINFQKFTTLRRKFTDLFFGLPEATDAMRVNSAGKLTSVE